MGLRPGGAGAPGGGVPVGPPPAGSAAGADSPPSLFGNGVRGGAGTSAGVNAAGSAAGAPPAGPLPGGAAGGAATGSGAGASLGAVLGAKVSKSLISYLKAHQGKAPYLVAAVGSGIAGSIALQSGREVIDMGGFMGSDPTPNLAKLKSFIDSGRLHYVLLGSSGSGGAAGAPGSRTSGGGGGRLGIGQGAPGGGGPGLDTSPATRAAIDERDTWIEKNGTIVHVSGESQGGMRLYYFAG